MDIITQLPDDLKYVVYQYGPFCYDKNHNNLMYNIKRNSARYYTKLHKLNYCNPRNNYTCLGDYLFSNCIDHEIYFNNLLKCKCCERHFTNDPKSWDNPHWDQNISGSKGSYFDDYDIAYNQCSNMCNCSCRRMRRFLVLTFHPNYRV